MRFFDRFLKKKKKSQSKIVDSNVLIETTQVVEEILLEFKEGEIVKFEDDVLDVTSSECIQKFKHNLDVLIKQVKKKAKLINLN